MEFDPTKKSESSSGENFNDGGLSQMPSYEAFDKARKEGKLPEGIRDEQDYREYMEEQSARTMEKERADQEAAAEKVEKIGTFEQRLEMNKKMYDDLAFHRARRLAAAGDAYEDYHREDIMEQNYLLENLYNGVVDSDIDNSSVIHWKYKTPDGKRSLDTGEIVLPNRNEDIFKRAFSRFAFESNPDSRLPGAEDIDKRAKEMMNTSKYEESFDEFLSASPEKISSYNINNIEKEIGRLESCSDLFNFEHDGSYTGHTLKGDTAIIPTLESRIRLEEQIVLVRKKIADIIAEVKGRELKADLEKSIQGRRIADRLKNDQ